MPTPDSCPGKKVSISLEFKMTYHTQRSTQPSVHLITPESHNYWKAISVQKLDSRLRKEIQMWAFRIEWKQNNGPVWRGCSQGNSLINRWTLQQSQSWVRETRRYSPFIPLGGTQGEGGCLAAEASIGSRGWALRLARCSAPRPPVQNRTMDWLREDLTSNMAEQEEDGNKRHQSGQLKLSILNKNRVLRSRFSGCVLWLQHIVIMANHTLSHVMSPSKRTHYHNEHKQRTWLF